MPLDRERIQQLLEVFQASSAGEFALQEGDRYVRFVRRGANAAAEAGEVAVETGEGVMPAPVAAAPERVTVNARVVGLFYRGKAPGQDPLVQVGGKVSEGQQLGIIEVLRKPTLVVSPVDGEVVQIEHNDADGVQYGDPLFVIQPS